MISGLSGPFWTSGSKVGIEWKWKTTDTYISYFNWDSTKPSKNQNCMVINNNGKWSDALCSDRHNCICESYPDVEPIEIAPIPPPATEATNHEPLQPNTDYSRGQGVFISNEQLEKLIHSFTKVQPPVVNVYVNNVVKTKDAEKVESSDVFTSKNVTKSENGYNVLVNNNIDSTGKCAITNEDVIPFFEPRGGQ